MNFVSILFVTSLALMVAQCSSTNSCADECEDLGSQCRDICESWEQCRSCNTQRTSCISTCNKRSLRLKLWTSSA
ncbi:hypothetical protein P5673_013160 [Acropora cervicornis]|uniref:Uncharacterized protein n=1 Tax=Acropora cervicornis TaxID=6130 RepID=A0AAD9QLQ7_ACRCE|nr:hypothetical protein P5673_013160 [Acropora cervicornis]